MAKPSTMPNKEKLAKLTTRQELDVRTASMRHAGRLLKRLASFAAGTNEDGSEAESMSMAEIRAAEIVLKKILPDLSAVQEVKADPLEEYTIDELMQILAGAVAGNEQLLQNPEIRSAVNASQTVVPIDKKAT